jgi:acyl-CoA reductase-like NAD-dependent aldehyde dehydrogenase
MSARKIIVERPIADEFISRMVAKTNRLKVGDPKEHDTIIGPLINEDALAAVRSRVEDAVAGGATLLAGGKAVGRCFQPTLLADVPDSVEFARSETFGPVASIEVVGSTEEAVQRANATSYGLSSGIITQNSDRGLALAQRIESGIVHVNDQPIGDEPQVPFGGVKESGFGRFGGKAVVDEFTELRWITVQSGSHPFPF